MIQIFTVCVLFQINMNWGIISCGKISNDFCLALKSKAKRHDHKIIGCAARNIENSEKFAATHDIPTFYGNYQELLNDQRVEIVYIGSINTCHFENCKEAINAGKHVVCEKPLVLNSEEAVVLFDLAKEKKVFLMEAMWSRFMPIYVELKDMIETGKLGKIHSASANFTTKMDSLPRIFNKNMA